MRFIKKFLVTVILLPFILSIANGSELQLSLDQALSLAQKNDLSLATARLEVETGDAQVREATSAALPNVSISGGLSHYMVVPKMYLPDPFMDGGGWITMGLPNDANASISLQQPIWLAGKVGMALKAARIYQQIARDGLVSNRAKLKSDVIKEYFGFVLTQEVVKVTEEALAQARRHAETVERMFNVGMASEFDMLRAQVEVQSLVPGIANARKNAELARISFCNRIGANPDDNIILTDELSDEIKQSRLLGKTEAFDAARIVRPEFKVYNLKERLDKISLKAEKRNIYWPNFTFGLNYRRNTSGQKISDMTDIADWPETFTWMLNAQIPLFDGFATPAKIQKAKIVLRRTKIEQTQLEQNIRLEVSLTLSELKRAQDQLNSLKAALDLAKRALDIAETRYEQGVSTELEVLDSQLALRNTRLSYLQGLYDLRVANAEYARVVENDDDFGGSK
ncbi:MAG: TolC family protein [Candidatus Hatepunaea meridiana]|nr:TolC family protein [Candidatus Hatepunaea meridiana]